MSADSAAMLAKMENFKMAVECSKQKVESELKNREHRFDELDKCVEDHSKDESDHARQRFFDRERRGLLAKCKKWTTADFDAIRVLGEGGFGIVHLVRLKGSEEYFALKQMYKAKNGWNATMRKNHKDSAKAEAKVLQEARSKWIVELFATFQDPDNIYMVMEFLQGGDLIGHLIRKGRFSFVETQFYMAELCEALDAVHRCGFVHRDVKPDNVVLTSAGHLKLLDSGVYTEDPNAVLDAEAAAAAEFAANTATTKEKSSERSTARTMLRECVGTPPYMAPEVFNACTGICYGIEADFWSLGIITFECLVGHVPFHAGKAQGSEATQVVKKLVQNSDVVLPSILDRATTKGLLTKTALDFIRGALHSDRLQRLTAERMRRDDFFSGIDFKNIQTAKPPIVPEVKGPGDAANFDDFGTHELPTAPASVVKDATLEWAHYEFDRSAHELHRPELNAEELFVNPVS